MTLPEKLDLTSHNLPADKTAELLRLFPEIRTEGDKIDFDKLKLVLGQTVDAGRERYGMTWPGKADCFKTIQAPSTGTLLPAPDESVDFDTTENLIIEGDNLNVLKLLQKAYLSKVKMIYIDPPYNTGNDFIYPDNYAESLQTYLEYTGQVDAEGRKFGTNTDTDGRFHSRWLNMMYPRLYLARNLLRDDGVVFISIDDNEVDNLRKLCNEIFGEECWLATIVWQNSSRNSDQIAIEHEYLHVYAKTPSANGTSWNRTRDIALNLEKKIQEYKHQGMAKEDAEKELSAEIDLLLEEDEHRGDKTNAWLTNYKNIDDDWNIYYPVDLSGEGNGPPRRFGDKEVPAPPGRHWMSQEYIDELLTQNRIAWRGDRAYRKLYIQESLENLKSVIRIPTRNGSETLKQILGKDVFDKPKPHNLLKQLAYYVTEKDDLILDFFAGSGSMAHAVLELNEEDEGNRRYILVQLPEHINENDKNQKTSFDFCAVNNLKPHIAEITKERVRRVIKKVNEKRGGQISLLNKKDRGFRVFKLGESNFKGWEAAVPKDEASLAKQLELHIDHIREGRTSEDILYEILLKSGFPLTTPVEKIEVEGKSAYSVAGGGMLICLEKDLALETVRAMAELKPQRVICLDMGFAGNDQLKANAVQIFKTKDIVFKTV